MEHKGTISLETNRLILRRFTLDDAKDMFNNWASNPNVTKHLTWPTHESIEITKNVITSWVNQYENKDYYQWAIQLKESGIIVGSISAFKIDESIEKVEIGYCIGEPWWNQKITSEALKEVIRFFFEEVNANRICACHDVINVNSGKVMLKCNMKYEGTFKEATLDSHGNKCDLAYYAILRKEYK